MTTDALIRFLKDALEISRREGGDEKSLLASLSDLTKRGLFGAMDLKNAYYLLHVDMDEDLVAVFKDVRKQCALDSGVYEQVSAFLGNYPISDIRMSLREQWYASYCSGNLDLDTLETLLWTIGYVVDSSFYSLPKEKRKEGLLLDDKAQWHVDKDDDLLSYLGDDC